MNHRGWILALGLLLPLAVPFVPAAQAQIFGESDEVKAARQKHEDDQDARATQIEARLQALEDKVQSLTQSLSQATGANEELGHQLQLQSDRIDREEKDFASRLCQLSAQILGAGGGQGLNCATSGAPGGATPGAYLPPVGQNSGPNGATGQPKALGGGQLGTLSSSGPPGAASGGFAPAPPQGPRQFDIAMNLLAKAQYTEASAAFRGFADANPDDQDLSPQALYWVGDIAFVQQDYPTAISVFAEEVKKYPNSSRSPDSMLKLGQALLATGNNKGGCTTLAALKTTYPQASASTLAAAANAHKAACTK